MAENLRHDSLFEHHRIIVDAGQSTIRIDKFLSNKIEHVSRQTLQKALKAAYVFVNEIPVKANYKVKPNDTIVIKLETPQHEITIEPEDIPLDIIYEDDALLVLNKPSGLVVHPGHGNYHGTLVNGLAHYFSNEESALLNDPRIGLVHRIDKDTSGLLVIAKTEQAKKSLSQQFFNKTTQRTYCAVTWGIPKPDTGTIEGHIARNTKDRTTFTVSPDASQGKHAITHYKVKKKIGYVSVVACKLETGRTHQIRVHFKHIGHPIFGDSTYGGDKILRGTTYASYKQFVKNCLKICTRQALHAQTLGFTHPETKEYMEFSSPLPQDISQLIEKWENYINNRGV